jgi:hypothetical protein
MLDPPDATGAEAGRPGLDEDYLILSTIHSAKGQEWDAIYVLHLSPIPTAPRSSIKVHSAAIPRQTAVARAPLRAAGKPELHRQIAHTHQRTFS